MLSGVLCCEILLAFIPSLRSACDALTSPLTTVSFAFCTAGWLDAAFMACCAAVWLLEGGVFGGVRGADKTDI
jgi:hypothetical protein